MRAIVHNPDDDLPRLVFADWLDEQGDPRESASWALVKWARKVAKIGSPRAS